MNSIQSVDALEILDSRGNPTVRVHLALSDNHVITASVPSGASTGQFEAYERRDGDPGRFNGKGVLGAVEAVREEIGPRIIGMNPEDQQEIDALMCRIDGTENKSRLGANAIIGVSMAVARAAAHARHMPLYRHIASLAGLKPERFRLPVLGLNVINGGVHAKNTIDFQEFMIVPHSAKSFSESLRWAAETYQALRGILIDQHLATTVGDEGGFAPNLKDDSQACEFIVEAIRKAGFRPGHDIGIALDPAATSFGSNADGYIFKKSTGAHLSRDEMVKFYQDWVERFPILSIEDGVADDDWEGYAAMNRALGKQIQLVGDDNYVTNVKFIQRGIEEKSTNAALIKLNQIGTVTETIAAIALCHKVGWNTVVSHRSGETEDSFISDLAVGCGCSQMKSGAPCRGERLAKYNRLLEIEHELGDKAEFSSPFL